jgi:hypothetical protein
MTDPSSSSPDPRGHTPYRTSYVDFEWNLAVRWRWIGSASFAVLGFCVLAFADISGWYRGVWAGATMAAVISIGADLRLRWLDAKRHTGNLTNG